MNLESDIFQDFFFLFGQTGIFGLLPTLKIVPYRKKKKKQFSLNYSTFWKAQMNFKLLQVLIGTLIRKRFGFFPPQKLKGISHCDYK